MMTCTHLNGGLQLPVHRQGGWFSHCLCCGEESPATGVTLPAEAGRLAALAVADMSQRHFSTACDGFTQAAALGGDPRCHMAALLCHLGVSFCGDEFQPTFSMAQPLRTPLTETPQWQALAQSADQLPPFVWQELDGLRDQLEAILTPLREGEGRSGCDVFLCYRRTRSNVRAAMKLFCDLKRLGLRVFCADVSTRGKTQEQFEAEVYHALHTAEYMVIFPGDGADALTPWMHNELIRAACTKGNRFVCSDGHSELPAGLGEALSLEEIRMRLGRFSADCTSPRLWERAIASLKAGDAPGKTLPLLERASARGDAAARLLLATLYDEGTLLLADRERAAHYRRLVPADEGCRQRVFAALNEVEQARAIARRQAVIYIAADVSDAGLAASQALLRPLLTALHADRRLASAEVCLVVYDLHARVLEAPKALEKYGLPENAVRMLYTLREGGRDQHACAAKGLRLCAAEQLARINQAGTPLVVLLSTGAASDSPAAIPAALASVQEVFANTHDALLTSAAQIPACVAGLLRAMN